MSTKFLKAVLALALGLAAPGAQAFVDPPVLATPNPVAGQPVIIDVTAGVCDGLGGSPPTITQNGNAIRIALQSIHSFDSEFCIYPTYTSTFVVGSFPPGSYSLQVDRTYMDAGGSEVTQTLGVLSFVVTAIIGLPALTLTGFAVLMIALALAALLALRVRRTHLTVFLVLATLLPSLSRAQSQQGPVLEVLLSPAQGAPTPDDVVAYFSTQHPASAQPPLESLAVGNPQSAGYLLPVRAHGAFLAYLQANPESARAELERYVRITYSDTANLQKALSALSNDVYVEAAYVSSNPKFSSASLVSYGVDQSGSSGPVSNGAQYGRDDLNADAAWQLAGGYAIIGDVDTGLYTAHPALVQFSSSGQYVGGNFIPANSLNIGLAGENGYPSTWTDPDVDELKPLPLPSNSVCNPNHLPAVPPSNAGHGTHVAGLIAANGDSGYGVLGTCKHCGIAMYKVSFPYCFSNGIVYVGFNGSAVAAAITLLADTGAQVINVSINDSDTTKTAGFCAAHPTYSWCVAITHAAGRDVTVVASAGNDRTNIQFPADDARVLDAGGFEQTLALWDLSPGNTTNCPSPNLTNEPLGDECGSDYTVTPGAAQQELMASANQVLSTTYPGVNWNLIGCGDGYPGPGWGNGKGWCTGTSMSAPQISGVVGILRSINPLVPASVPNPNPNLGQPVGIRAVLARTTFEAQAGQSQSPTFGYGHPDAAAAAKKMLGTVAGRQVLNRVTPLFRFYSASAQDYADTTSVQGAVALMYNQTDAYQPQGLTVPGYPVFPQEPGLPAFPAPKAAVFVLTTEYTPQIGYPPLVPIYQMDRERAWPQGCTGGSGCNLNHRDFTLFTTVADVQQAHTDGFNLRNIQGYIYQTCSPEPTCIPPGAQKFYRECNTTLDDCATFLESERATFEANGYTAAYPATSSKVLGYAYPNVDSDGDGLVDGMEYVIGTNPFLAQSGGAGIPDGQAYPQAGVEVVDPCLGPAAINCPANFIFKNGFE